MRKLLLITCFGLTGTVAAEAHWPLTYVGSPAIHRFEGPVQQVTLLQPHIEEATSREGQQVRLVTSADKRLSQLLLSSAPNAEYGISVGSFLREPEPTEQLFRNDEVFAPELGLPANRYFTINGVSR